MRRVGLALWATAIIAAAQPSGTGIVSGIVVDKADGQPVRKAIVTLRLATTPSSWAEEMTDSVGRFTFQNLPAGKYNLSAQKPGVGNARYGSEDAFNPGAYLELANAETRTDVALKLIRAASLSGTVLDSFGQPLVNAEVGLFTVGYSASRSTVAKGRTRTNDRGEYRFANLQPDHYFVRVEQGATYSDGPRLITQYFGGAAEIHKARPIVLKSGDEVAGIDFRILEAHLVTVAGQVTGIPADRLGESPTRQLRVTLRRAKQEPSDRFSMGVGAALPDYSFQFRGVIEGEYILTCEFEQRGTMHYAVQEVNANRDITDIGLALTPGFTLKGQVVLDGPGNVDFTSMETRLIPAPGAAFTRDVRARVNRNGTFLVEGVPPGSWQVWLSKPTREPFVKAMHMGDRVLGAEAFETPIASDATLRITLTAEGGRVQGKVAGGSVGRVPIMVVLAPEIRTSQRVFAVVNANDDGTFKTPEVAPGAYHLFALERPPLSTNLVDPDWAQRLWKFAEKIEIKSGSQVESSPNVITASQLREALQ